MDARDAVHILNHSEPARNEQILDQLKKCARMLEDAAIDFSGLKREEMRRQCSDLAHQTRQVILDL